MEIRARANEGQAMLIVVHTLRFYVPVVEQHRRVVVSGWHQHVQTKGRSKLDRPDGFRGSLSKHSSGDYRQKADDSELFQHFRNYLAIRKFDI
jgi:hypothetical protein